MAAKVKDFGKAPEGYHNLVFHCPGCKYDHPFAIVLSGETLQFGSTHPIWSWNGSFDEPTFHPSLDVNRDHPSSCHSFVNEGRIQFLGDSHHDLKGQTVDLPDWEGW